MLTSIKQGDKMTVTAGTSQYIDYTYDATGVLLRKQQYNAGTLQKTTDYIEGFVFENTTSPTLLPTRVEYVIMVAP